jgi:hypothetical protein
MKLSKILGIFGATLVLVLLLVALPVLPAMAVNDISLSPTSGKTGSTINVVGEDFTTYESSGDLEYYAEVYFARDSVAVGASSMIGDPANDDVHTYNFVTESTDMIDADGYWEASFTVPTRLTNGSNDEDVVAGTYYVYVTITKYDNGTDTETQYHSIRAKASFTITAGGTISTPSPSSGPSGTDVTLSGSGFQVSYPIIFRLDSINMTPKSGDSYTNTTGGFTSVVTIPQTTAGSHTIYVTVGTVTVSTVFAVTASASLNSLSVASGPAGTDVTVSGSNFLPSYPVILKFDTTTLTPKSGDTNTNTSGGFASVITIPESTAGVHNISVTVGTMTLTAQFTVTAPTTTTTTTTTPTTTTTTQTTTTKPPAKAVLSINASGNNVGAVIGVGGAGFAPNSKISVRFDNTEVATTTASADGVVLVTFNAPPAKHGDHTITVTDGNATGTATFTVESVPPATPQPLKPEMNAKVKSPVTFSWQPSTDPAPASNPVTYELQISLSETFASGTVIIDDTGLATTNYNLTAAEEALLAGRTAPYYWRIKAIDAASNESPWTGTGAFYAPGGGASSFPSWALFTVIGVGAVIVFLIGYWLGRRSAFYY